MYVEYGLLETDGHSVVLTREGECMHIPVGAVSAILVMPGTTVTHAAVKTCAEADCLLLWVGENGVRLYSSGNPGRKSDALLRQSAIFLNPAYRLGAAKRIFRRMFDRDAPDGRSIEQLRGIEGGLVKEIYRDLAKRHGVTWSGRNSDNALSDPLNLAISSANACLYGLVEAVVVAMGYSPAIGFVHAGDPRSFVFDVADCLKFKTVVPMAFSLFAHGTPDIGNAVRHHCRDVFRQNDMAGKIVAVVDEIMDYGQTGGF